MEYRRLGKSGLRVSELSYGSWVTFSFQLDKAKAKKTKQKNIGKLNKQDRQERMNKQRASHYPKQKNNCLKSIKL